MAKTTTARGWQKKVCQYERWNGSWMPMPFYMSIKDGDMVDFTAYSSSIGCFAMQQPTGGRSKIGAFVEAGKDPPPDRI